MARIRIATTPDDSAPPSGQVSIYAKSDDNLYLKNSAGSEFLLLTDSTPGVGGYSVEQHSIDLAQYTAKEIELDNSPTQPLRTLLFIDGAPPAFYGLDYTVSGNVLTWSGTRLDGLLEVSDRVKIVYF